MIIQRRVFIFLVMGALAAPTRADGPAVKPATLVARAVKELVPLQETDGDWPYEGVYRVRGEIPIGYRIGGTALVSQALLYGAPPTDKNVTAAMERGLDFMFAGLADSRMAPSTRDAYDVRVWGQCCALEYLCRLRAAKRWFDRREKVDSWIPKLTAALIEEELSGGGWNYGNTRVLDSTLRPFCSTTGLALMALAGRRGNAAIESAITFLKGELPNVRSPISLGWGLLGLAAWDQRPDNADDWLSEAAQRCIQQSPNTHHEALLLLADAGWHPANEHATVGAQGRGA